MLCPKCKNEIEHGSLKCEKCGTTINETAKFCPECGTKVENPVISIKPKKESSARRVPDTLLNKITFFVFSGLMIALFVVMLIGCFGDILKVYENPRHSGLASLLGSDSKVSIDYFFGKAIKDIDQSTKDIRYPEYKIFMIVMLIFEYMCWIGAIASAIAGLTYSIVKICKGYNKKDYTINNGFYAASILSGLPYLFIFAIEKTVKISAEYSAASSLTSTSSYELNMTFGWGTIMIMIATIVAVCLFAIQRVITAITEKKNIVRVSIISGISIVFFSVLLASLGKAIGINYSTTGISINGFASVFSVFPNYLYQYSSDIIKDIPDEAVQCFIGSILLLVSYLIGAIIVELFIRKPEKIILISIVGTLMTGLTIAGSVIAYEGAKKANAFSTLSSSATADSWLSYSGFGIALPIVIILSITGLILAQKLKIRARA